MPKSKHNQALDKIKQMRNSMSSIIENARYREVFLHRVDLLIKVWGNRFPDAALKYLEILQTEAQTNCYELFGQELGDWTGTNELMFDRLMDLITRGDYEGIEKDIDEVYERTCRPKGEGNAILESQRRIANEPCNKELYQAVKNKLPDLNEEKVLNEFMFLLDWLEAKGYENSCN